MSRPLNGTPLWISISLIAWLAIRPCGAAEKADAAKSDSLPAQKKALSAFQAFVGEWKGVGQPRRGSSQGAWSEETQWAWRFTAGHAELAAQLAHDPYFSALRLEGGERSGHFQLSAIPAGEKAEAKSEGRFDGAVGDDGQLVMTATGDPQADRPARLTLRVVASGDRLVMLYERRNGEKFIRLAEVGSTRKGSSFAVKGAGGHECIVTGGEGTIAVEYKGQTYYVCCTGCRDLFKQDPEKVLAEYRERQKQDQASGSK